MSNKLIQQIDNIADIKSSGLYEYNNEIYNNTCLYKNIWTDDINPKDVTRKGFKVEIKNSDMISTGGCIRITDSLGYSFWLGIDSNGLSFEGGDFSHYQQLEISGESIILPLNTPKGTVIWWKIEEIQNMWGNDNASLWAYVSRPIEKQTKNLNIAGEHPNSTKLNDIKENKAYGGYSLVTGRTSYAGVKGFTITGAGAKQIQFNNLDDNEIINLCPLRAIYSYYINTTKYEGECKITGLANNQDCWQLKTNLPNATFTQTTNSSLGNEYQPDNFDNEVNIIFFPDYPNLGNRPIGYASFSSGRSTIAARKNSHAEGNKSKAFGAHSHAEGESTKAYGSASHAEGLETIAKGEASHASGWKTIAEGKYSLTSGYNTKTTDICSAAFGQNTIAGKFAFSAGNGNEATGENSVALGYKNKATGKCAIALGGITGNGASSPNIAEGNSSIAVGFKNHAKGALSIAGGSYCETSNNSALAFGNHCKATGEQSVALGYYTNAQNITDYTYGQIAVGRYNEPDSEAVFIVGNAKTNSSPSTAFSVQMDGSIKVQSEQIATLKITTTSGEKTYNLLKVSEVGK